MTEKQQRRDSAIRKTFVHQDGRKQRGLWLANIRNNFDIIAKAYDVKAIQDAFWDMPGIVVGAGPSLSKNIDLLAEAGKSHPLFCTDRAFGQLHEKGTVPHFTIVGDASPRVATFFSGMDTRRTTLIAAAYIDHSVFDLPWKNVVLYNITDYDTGYVEAAQNMTEQAGNRITAIPGAVNVGNVAFICAKIAGCNPITFTGNDLCQDKPSDTSARWYEGTDHWGNKVYSAPGYLAGYEWLLDFFKVDKDIKCGKLSVYNSTEGGIMYSDLIREMPLKDYLERFPGYRKSINTIIEKKLRP